MCHSTNPEAKSVAKGENSNSDSINVQIIENLKDHQSMVFTVLLIIAVVVVMHFLYKIYTSHKKRVVKAALRRSRADINRIDNEL